MREGYVLGKRHNEKVDRAEPAVSNPDHKNRTPGTTVKENEY
jgi:hypothetical protein